MSSKQFESLSQSLKEAGKILHGEEKPSRKFTFELKSKSNQPRKALAICLETDDETLLIRGKVYEVEVLKKYLCVFDEEGESVICELSSFLIVEFNPQTEQILRNSVLSIEK
jgi:hypothetical protein